VEPVAVQERHGGNADRLRAGGRGVFQHGAGTAAGLGDEADAAWAPVAAEPVLDLVEEPQGAGPVVVSGHDQDRGDGLQLAQGIEAAAQGVDGRDDGVEQVAAVDDQVGFGSAGDLDDLGQDGVEVVVAASSVDLAS